MTVTSLSHVSVKTKYVGYNALILSKKKIKKQKTQAAVCLELRRGKKSVFVHRRSKSAQLKIFYEKERHAQREREKKKVFFHLTSRYGDCFS